MTAKFDFSFDIYSLGMIFYYILAKSEIPKDTVDNLTVEDMRNKFTGFSGLSEPY